MSIDEVESLTAARAGAMAGTEPSDGLRVSVCRKCARIDSLVRSGGKCFANPIGQAEAAKKRTDHGDQQSG